MTFLKVAAVLISCVLAPESMNECWLDQRVSEQSDTQVAGAVDYKPAFSGESVDVVLTAKAALVWDEQSGEILYEKQANERRPMASLSKLVSALVVRELVSTDDIVTIPEQVRGAQRKGVDVKLPVGEHATVYDLLSAGLIASANDAFTSLAVHAAGGEEEFTIKANRYVVDWGINNTRISNATGLDGGEQYSTAYDIKSLFQLAYHDQLLRNLLVSERGDLKTSEGSIRQYKSTNKLLGTYFPVLAAKTGYTATAGENLVVMTYGEAGQRVGAVVLGSEDRFQDMKTLVEWIWRNYSWP